MKIPRIGYLVTPITFGGSEKVVLNFLKKVDRDKFDIYPIIIIRPWEEETFFEKELLNLNYSYSKVHVSSNATIDLLRYVRSYRNIKLILKSQSIDLLHTHGYLADIIGLVVAKSLGTPIVSTCHGFVFKSVKLRLYFKIDLFALRYFNGIIAVSNNIRHFLLANGIKSSTIEVIPNAVDISMCNCSAQPNQDLVDSIIPRDTSDLILGYVGRISEEKGVKYLIEAVATLKSNGISATLMVIGEGPDQVELQQLARERGIYDNVIFLGFQDDISPFLRTMDIFVLPSLTEGTPLALLEAMSANVPVVATRVGGVPDVIDDGITGLLVNPRSHIELAKAIIKLHSDSALKSIVTENASALIEKRYSMASWIAQIQEHYHNILNAEIYG